MKALYYQCNQKSGDAVLLIHGWAGSLEMWDHVTHTLAAAYKVVKVDLWGHGKSESPGAAVTADQIAAALECVLCATDSSDCFIVGHSMGVAIGLCLAKLMPQMVNGILSVEGIYPYAKMYASRERPTDDRARLSIFKRMLAPRADEHWAKVLIAKMMKVSPTTLDKYSRFLGTDRVNLLKSVSKPYRLLSRSSYRGQLLFSHLWEDFGLNSDYVTLIPNTQTHFVVEENPAESTQCIVDALESLRSQIGR